MESRQAYSEVYMITDPMPGMILRHESASDAAYKGAIYRHFYCDSVSVKQNI